jgi:endonuclease YncB( thermonuclease family)
MKMAIRVISVSLALLVAIAGHAPAADSKQGFSGVVDTVIDGDLIRVTLDEGQKIPEAYTTCSKVYKTMAWVRLYAVRAPDPVTKQQLCSKEAKALLKNLTQDRKVKVEAIGCPPNGGLTGVVTVGDGLVSSKNLSVEVIKAGLAKVAIPGASTSPTGATGKYFEAEKTAMMAGLGLWGKKGCAAK